MSENHVLVSFDQEQREAIRQALKAYMRAHAIGVPALRTRLEDTDERRREIPQSTLQRFLRGSHRTGDAYVAQCAQFLEREGISLEPEADDPLAQMEAALCAFITPAEEQESGDELPARITGRYQPAEAGYLSVEVEITPSPQGRALRVSEEHRMAMNQTLFRYDGMLVRRAGALFGMLRNQLTCEPRVYWLWRGGSFGDESGTVLKGQVCERPFKLVAPEGDPVALAPVYWRKLEDEQ